ncbi:MAG: DUF2971 domain-containing protein [Acidobacteria bacterium]|nr:DUF2971 domain-containing protein [Acidobacteriota bacterium]
MQITHSQKLDKILQQSPPKLLFHYTSPAAFLGIVQNKQIWASNTRYLNDLKEIEFAVDISKGVIENLLGENSLPDEEQELLKEMNGWSGSAARRVYIFSMTEERDLLSQWRAYCPKSGGYSIGFPSIQLQLMATRQNFFLSSCVYDNDEQYQIISEIINSFLQIYRGKINLGKLIDEARKETVYEFAQHLGLFGGILKHPSFKEEKEWRLLSAYIDERHPQVDFRVGANGIVPFFKFNLVDEEHSDLTRMKENKGGFVTIVGPTRDSFASQMAVQFALTKYLGGAWNGCSNIPYNTY